MQQQFFKTMEHAFFGSKSQQGSKVGKARSQVNQKSSKYFVDFELTDHQHQAMKLKLPAGFFLISPNNGELQKFRIEHKANFHQKDTAGSKHNLIKAKKEQKKMESKERLAQLHAERRPENKQPEKSMQAEKPKKEKKEIKGHGRKPNQQKSALQIQQNLQELIEQIQKQEHGEKKPEETVKRKQKQVKQKKNMKDFSALQKQPVVVPAVKIQFEAVEKEPEKIVVKSEISHAKPVEVLQEQHQLSIPCLANNAQRYDPSYYHSEIAGSCEENTLCYYFGLPFSGSISEVAPRLNEKQKKFCNNIIQRLKNHRSSQAFRVPVDPLSQGVPDYYSIVYTPMDLRTIQKKINKDRYHYISQFHADINMIFLNSYKYNLRETIYFEATVQFEDYYHQLLRDAKKNPDQYTKEYVTKFNKARNDSGELDYTEHTPKKQRKKNESMRIGMNLTKSQILEKERKGIKLLKNKSIFEDQSGALSQSFVMETVNDFNVENLALDNNESKVIRKEQTGFKSRMKRVESIQLSLKEVLPEKQKQQIQHPAKTQKPQAIEIADRMDDEKVEIQVEMPEGKKMEMAEEPIIMPVEVKGHRNKRYGNDDYNDEDQYLMENFDCAFEMNSQNSCTNKASIIFDGMNVAGSLEVEKSLHDMLDQPEPEDKIINEPGMTSPTAPTMSAMVLQKKFSKVGRKSNKQHKQQSKPKEPKKQKEQKIKQQIISSPPKSNLQSNILKQTPRFGTTDLSKFYNPTHQGQGHSESIIVNNINSLPQSYVPNLFHGSVDILTQNTEHPNSGATTATVTIMNNAIEPKVSGISKGKKFKQKNKNIDEQYRCESDDDYVVESSRAHARRNKEKKITKSKMNKQSSNSGEHQAYPPQRKRGRQPKKVIIDSNFEDPRAKNSAERDLHHHLPSYSHEQLYPNLNIDALQLPHYIPEALIPNQALLPFGNDDYQEGDILNNEGSIFYQNSRQEQQNSQNLSSSKMV